MKGFYRTGALIFLFGAAIFLTVFSSEASEYAADALRVCALCVIPSLFPYMVISHMIVSCGVAHYIGAFFPISRLFSLPSCATAPMILGALCGFPVGAKSACQTYLRGDITKEECEVLISASSNTGPSFVVSVIGASFFHSALFGWQLYFFQLLASLISSLLTNRIIFPIKHNKQHKKADLPPLSRIGFCNAVADSCISTLTVCGFIVFFSVISGFLVSFVMKLSPVLASFISATMEFSKGTAFAATVAGVRGRFLCGLSLGFSGLCVLSQTLAITAQHGLSLKRTVVTKIIQGLLTGLMAAFIPPLFSENIIPASLPSLYSQASSLSFSYFETVIFSIILCFFSIKHVTRQ